MARSKVSLKFSCKQLRYIYTYGYPGSLTPFVENKLNVNFKIKFKYPRTVGAV